MADTLLDNTHEHAHTHIVLRHHHAKLSHPLPFDLAVRCPPAGLVFPATRRNRMQSWILFFSLLIT